MNDQDSIHRGALLLRIGSPGEGDGPSPGFEERVRERVAVAVTPAALSWADSLGRVARPGLAMAAIVTVATVAIHLWDRARGDELTILAENDAELGVLLDDVLEEGLP